MAASSPSFRVYLAAADRDTYSLETLQPTSRLSRDSGRAGRSQRAGGQSARSIRATGGFSAPATKQPKYKNKITFSTDAAGGAVRRVGHFIAHKMRNPVASCPERKWLYSRESFTPRTLRGRNFRRLEGFLFYFRKYAEKED